MKRRVQTRYVRRIAAHAIFDRTKSDASQAIISCDRDPADNRAVILHVNSSGNYLAAKAALNAEGYLTEPTGYDPFVKGNYGCQLRVMPAVKAAA